MERSEAQQRLRMRLAFASMGSPRSWRRFDEEHHLRDGIAWSRRDVLHAISVEHAATAGALLVAAALLAAAPLDAVTTAGELAAALAGVVLVLRLRSRRPARARELVVVGVVVAGGLGAGFLTEPPNIDDWASIAFAGIWLGLVMSAVVAATATVRRSDVIAGRAARLTACSAAGLAVLDVLHRPSGRDAAYIATALALVGVAHLLGASGGVVGAHTREHDGPDGGTTPHTVSIAVSAFTPRWQAACRPPRRASALWRMEHAGRHAPGGPQPTIRR